MDYKTFYADVVDWINQANLMAAKHGMASPDFWAWVSDSASAMGRKYQDNSLVIKQMVMLIEWLEEVYKNQKGR